MTIPLTLLVELLAIIYHAAPRLTARIVHVENRVNPTLYGSESPSTLETPGSTSMDVQLTAHW